MSANPVCDRGDAGSQVEHETVDVLDGPLPSSHALDKLNGPQLDAGRHDKDSRLQYATTTLHMAGAAEPGGDVAPDQNAQSYATLNTGTQYATFQEPMGFYDVLA